MILVLLSYFGFLKLTCNFFLINDCTKLLFYANFDYISLRHLIDFATIIKIILRALFTF